MKFLQYPFFWQLWALGLLAFLLWLIAAWFDPKNRQVGGTWKGTFERIGPSMTTALISHFILCVILVNYGKLDEITTFGSGFTSQSIVPKLLNFAMQKIQRVLGGDDAEPERPKKVDPPEGGLT